MMALGWGHPFEAQCVLEPFEEDLRAKVRDGVESPLSASSPLAVVLEEE
jgi:hypothetical protein